MSPAYEGRQNTRWKIPNQKFEIRNSNAGREIFARIRLVKIGYPACGFLAGRRNHPGHHNLDGIEMITVSTGLGVPNTLAAETEGAPGVGPGRNLRVRRDSQAP